MVKVGWLGVVALVGAGSIARADAPTNRDIAIAFQTFEGFDRVLAPQVEVTGLVFPGDCGARFGHPRSVTSVDDRRALYECLHHEEVIVVREAAMDGVAVEGVGLELRLETSGLVAALELDAHGKIGRIAPPGAAAGEAAWPTFEMPGQVFTPPPAVAATLDEAHAANAVLRFCVAADGKIVSHRLEEPAAATPYARAVVAHLLGMPPKPASDPKTPTMCLRGAFGYPAEPLAVTDPVLPKPPLPLPRLVAPQMLEGHRIAGERAIHPDAATFAQIKADKRAKVVGTFKVCVDDTGAISKVQLIKSTGYPAYDAELSRGISAWRYSPYEVNGAPIRVCTAVTFIFSP